VRLPFVVLLLVGCKSHDKPPAPEPAPAPAPPAPAPSAPPLPSPPASLPAPPANAAITPEDVALGAQLFVDPRLSLDGKRTCATCHDPARGYSGDVAPAADGKPNARRTPALVNLAWVRELGWDGRGATMREFLSPHLAGQLDNVDAIAARIGQPAPAILGALEAFVRTRYDGDSPWDALERTANKNGGDPVVRGYQLFTGKAMCAQCHTPPLYTDGGYHAVIPDKLGDKGRGLVDPALTGAFRTPTLRGVTRRSSFFHDGSVSDLTEALAHAGVALVPEEQRSLVLFLDALSGRIR